jgi:hypothetical protein
VTAPAVRGLDPEALAAEVEHQRGILFDLAAQMTALTATAARDQAEIRKLRLLAEALVEIVGGLCLDAAPWAVPKVRSLQARCEPNTATQPAGSYQAAAAVQARRRAIHAVTAADGAR